MLKSNSRQTLSDIISFLCIERFPPRRRRKIPEIQQAHKLLLSESWFTMPFPRLRKHSATVGEGGSGQPSSKTSGPVRLPSRLQRAPGCSLWVATLLGQCRGVWVIPAPVTKPKKILNGSPSWTLVQLLLFCVVGSLSGVSRRVCCSRASDALYSLCWSPFLTAAVQVNRMWTESKMRSQPLKDEAPLGREKHLQTYTAMQRQLEPCLPVSPLCAFYGVGSYFTPVPLFCCIQT